MSTLRDQLQAIYDDVGDLTPALVVETAANPEHPLHSRLTWDDTEAARKWRLEEAAQLIRSVRIAYTRKDGTPADLRAFTAIKGEEAHTSTYMPTEEALADPLTRALVLRSMKRDWMTFKRRYDHLAEFAALIASETEGIAS